MLGASWGENGTIIAALNSATQLWRIPEAGGTPQALLDLSAGAAYPMWPQVLPRGQVVVYTALAGDADNATVEALSIQDRKRVVLVRGGTFGRYLSNGYLTYVNQGTLYAVRFDQNRLSVDGPRVPLLQDISYSRTFGYAQLDVSQTGTVVYRKGAEGARK